MLVALSIIERDNLYHQYRYAILHPETGLELFPSLSMDGADLLVLKLLEITS